MVLTPAPLGPSKLRPGLRTPPSPQRGVGGGQHGHDEGAGEAAGDRGDPAEGVAPATAPALALPIPGHRRRRRSRRRRSDRGRLRVSPAGQVTRGDMTEIVSAAPATARQARVRSNVSARPKPARATPHTPAAVSWTSPARGMRAEDAQAQSGGDPADSYRFQRPSVCGSPPNRPRPAPGAAAYSSRARSPPGPGGSHSGAGRRRMKRHPYRLARRPTVLVPVWPWQLGDPC